VAERVLSFLSEGNGAKEKGKGNETRTIYGLIPSSLGTPLPEGSGGGTKKAINAAQGENLFRGCGKKKSFITEKKCTFFATLILMRLEVEQSRGGENQGVFYQRK